MTIEEKAITYCPDDAYPFGPAILKKIIREAFIAGYNLREKEMMDEAVETVVENWNVEPHPEITIPLNPEKFTAGDKVKIIIVKED